MKRRASSPRQGAGGGLTPAQKAKWLAAAQLATQALRAQRQAVTSHAFTFSALNVDGICASRLEEGEKEGKLTELKRQQKLAPDSEAETSSDLSGKDDCNGLSDKGRCLSAGLSSMASATGDEAQALLSESEEMLQQETAASPASEDLPEPAAEEAPAAESTPVASEGLGDFFKSPKAKKTVRKSSKKSSEEAAQQEAAPAEVAEEQQRLLPLPEESCGPSSEQQEAAPKQIVTELPVLEPEEMRAFLLSHRNLAGPTPAELRGLVTQASVQSAEPPLGLSLRRAGRQLSTQSTAPSPFPISIPESPMSRQNSCLSTTGDLNRQITAPVGANPFCMARQTSVPVGADSFALTRQTSAPVPNTFDKLRPSPKAYRPSFGSKSRIDELRRAIKSQLNKVCPESVGTIASRISEVEVKDAEELQEVISIIFHKALSEPHYCATYADLVFQIKSAFPEFPGADGGKPQTFKTLLLNVCQVEFESLPTSLEPSSEEKEQCDAEELEYRRKKTKDRLLANMKLIGHLFLRQMLSPRVIGAVIEELTLCHGETVDRVPADHCVECAVELLLSIGHTLEALPVGKAAITSVCGRLMDLKKQVGKDGRSVYSKRIQFAIQDLLDVRAAGWARKVFSGVARTKEEIRLEQQRDLKAQASGKEVKSGQLIISGLRPGYIGAVEKDA